MQFITKIMSIALLAWTNSVSAVALPEGASITTKPFREGYTNKVLGFHGTIHGVEVTLNGTVESMYSQFTTLHPHATASDVVAGITPSSDEIDLFDRDTTSKTTRLCCPLPGTDFLLADTDKILDGIDYLKEFKGICNVGGHACARVSCSWQAAIFLCNDNKDEIRLNCGYVATYAEDIVQGCTITQNNPPVFKKYTCGAEWDTDNYNVIVTWHNKPRC